MSEDAEFWKDFLSLMRGLDQDARINQAELVLLDTPDVHEVPLPGSCHPALAHAADFVRSRNMASVKIYMIRHGLVSARGYTKDEPKEQQTVEHNTAILTRKKCSGPAPFVGDARMNQAAYFWDIWVDDYGRAIAGESRLIWRY